LVVAQHRIEIVSLAIVTCDRARLRALVIDAELAAQLGDVAIERLVTGGGRGIGASAQRVRMA
jgi:hypothetical protein